jgi:hypothetical protein
MGPLEFIDTMIKDGLMDAFNGYHMGNTAENVAKEWQITREQQDQFAVASQNKAEAARKAGRFKDEIAAVSIKEKKGEKIIDTDEYIRDGVTYESIKDLRPAFLRDGGSVTAANASGINDGAAAVVLMSAKEADRRGLKPLGFIKSWAQAGVDPKVMGTGPIPASRAALKRAGWSVADLDLVEANEAFAAQACAVNKDMGWDPTKVNVNGGAIAIGHPIGASGGRVLVTLLHEMQKRNARKGLATLCIGGGMGIAAACDIRIAASDAVFRMPAARMGLGYNYVGMERFVNLMGPANAADIFFSARKFDGAEAMRMGYVNRVVDVAQFDAEVLAYAQLIGENAPLTIKAAKRTIREIRTDSDKRDVDVVQKMVDVCFASADYKEGRTAFMEKRTPQFKGV